MASKRWATPRRSSTFVLHLLLPTMVTSCHVSSFPWPYKLLFHQPTPTIPWRPQMRPSYHGFMFFSWLRSEVCSPHHSGRYLPCHQPLTPDRCDAVSASAASLIHCWHLGGRVNPRREGQVQTANLRRNTTGTSGCSLKSTLFTYKQLDPWGWRKDAGVAGKHDCWAKLKPCQHSVYIVMSSKWAGQRKIPVQQEYYILFLNTCCLLLYYQHQVKRLCWKLKVLVQNNWAKKIVSLSMVLICLTWTCSVKS